MTNTLSAAVIDVVRWSLLAAVVVVGSIACGDGGSGEVDINSLLEDPSGEHGHDHASEGAGSEGASSDMSLVGTTGDLPDLEMLDVSTGASVNLQSLVGDSKPLLLWFWAPH